MLPSKLPIHVCLKLFNALVIPKLLYGLAALCLPDNMYDRLDYFIDNALCDILGVDKNCPIPRTLIRAALAQPTAKQRIQEAQLRLWR